MAIGASKRAYLERNFGGSGLFWIEDNVQNATDGLEVGLNPLLMAHGYSRDYAGPIPRVMNWEEIYRQVTATYTETALQPQLGGVGCP